MVKIKELVTKTRRIKKYRYHTRGGTKTVSSHIRGGYITTPNPDWVKSRIIDGKKFILQTVLITRNAADSSAQLARSQGKYLARVIPSKTKGFAVYIHKRIPL